MEEVVFDVRWIGNHGIGRLAGKAKARSCQSGWEETQNSQNSDSL